MAYVYASDVILKDYKYRFYTTDVLSQIGSKSADDAADAAGDTRFGGSLPTTAAAMAVWRTTSVIVCSFFGTQHFPQHGQHFFNKFVTFVICLSIGCKDLKHRGRNSHVCSFLGSLSLHFRCRKFKIITNNTAGMTNEATHTDGMKPANESAKTLPGSKRNIKMR